MTRAFASLFIALSYAIAPLAADDVHVLTADEQESQTLYAALQRQAYEALDRRAEQVEQLETADQIKARAARLRERFIESLGGFPERTPLNAETVRTIQADGYRIEMVIFESQPNHHITANLYLPDAEGPVPGVAVSSGHSRTAKTADYNQRFGIMMARHGMAALCFDPIGQGERSQILDEDGHPEHGGTTTEHALIGVGSMLVGRNTATYRTWDGIRAVDYLTSRPEIDPQRIGYTGCSGGGTLTSYVMALDDRIACAAPACYLTSFRRLIETLGPQDAEQNIFGQLAYGMDHADYILMRAPKPTLISSTTDDFFDIDGTWHTYRQAKRIYGLLGYPERVDLVEMPGDHGVKPQNLATIAHWMQRWLLDKDAAVPIAELPTRDPEELLCTETGQVLTSIPGELSVSDLNAALAQQLRQQRKSQQSDQRPKEQRRAIAAQLGVSLSQQDATARWESRGTIERSGYTIEKGIVQTDAKRPLPALRYQPENATGATYLYLHPAGKQLDVATQDKVVDLVKQGNRVITIDLSGQGETANGKRDRLLTEWKTFNLAYLLGTSPTSIRTSETLAAADFADSLDDASDGVHLRASGSAGIVALHAAALAPAKFASVSIRDTPATWESIVSQATPAGQLDSVVPGALRVYDLPDLVRLTGEEKVSVASEQQ